jgi:replicative DNA helicase
MKTQKNELKTKKTKLSENLSILTDPYGYYFEEEFEEENPEESLDDTHVELNIENYAIEIKDRLSDAVKNKRKFVSKAMQFDPAFLIDPIEEHYKSFIPPAMLGGLNQEEIEEVLSVLDPVTWGRQNLLLKHGGWEPRNSKKGVPYQTQLIRCKSKRIVVRAGRRIGKTAALVVRLLWKAFTWNSEVSKKPAFNIVIFTPNQSQIKLIFKMIEIFIDGNPRLLSMIKNGGKIPTKQQPHYALELNNGVSFYGFVSGSTAIRGQAADVLVLDEASFLTSDDTDAVLALINEHKDVELFVSSTPKGIKDYFYERVHDPSFVSFFFPSDKYHPKWNKKMEEEFRSQLTDSGYQHEVLANFSGDGEGVFQIPFIEEAYNNSLSYSLFQPNKQNVYGMGVDWNDPENGTQIKVVEFNRSINKFRIVDSASIHIEQWTQTAAVHKIKDLNRKWNPAFIYVDQGYGGTQVENLHEMGLKAQPGTPDRKLTQVKGIKFKSVIEVFDPWMKKKIRKETKPFMVNNAVRIFEDQMIEIPQDAHNLKKQLEGYIIDRITPSGTPVYGKDSKVGDHELDAMLLALFGFTMELSSLGRPVLKDSISPINNNPLKPNRDEISTTGIPELDRQILEAKVANKQYERAKEKERELVALQGGKTMAFTEKPILTSSAIPFNNGSTAILQQLRAKSTHTTRRGIFKNSSSKIKTRRTF